MREMVSIVLSFSGPQFFYYLLPFIIFFCMIYLHFFLFLRDMYFYGQRCRILLCVYFISWLMIMIFDFFDLLMMHIWFISLTWYILILFHWPDILIYFIALICWLILFHCPDVLFDFYFIDFMHWLIFISWVRCVDLIYCIDFMYWLISFLVFLLWLYFWWICTICF